MKSSITLHMNELEWREFFNVFFDDLEERINKMTHSTLSQLNKMWNSIDFYEYTNFDSVLNEMHNLINTT